MRYAEVSQGLRKIKADAKFNAITRTRRTAVASTRRELCSVGDVFPADFKGSYSDKKLFDDRMVSVGQKRIAISGDALAQVLSMVFE